MAQLAKIETVGKAKKKYRGSAQARHDLSAYLLISPMLIGFFVFTLYPILWVIHLAWYHYTGIPSQTAFTGWENFIRLFTVDSTYWRALLNTFLLVICKLPIELPLALILGLLLNKKTFGSNFFRIMYYLPSIISMAIIGIIFSNMFGYFGYINGLLTKLGIMDMPVEWFSQKSTAMVVIITASVWNTFGINVLYFLAALQNVPQELYESAALDGAGKWQQFKHVTIPMIFPVLRIIILMALNGTMQTSEFILMLTNGAPGGKTDVLMTHLLKNVTPGFVSSGANLGYGSAMACITAIILACVSMIYMKLSKKELY